MFSISVLPPSCLLRKKRIKYPYPFDSSTRNLARSNLLGTGTWLKIPKEGYMLGIKLKKSQKLEMRSKLKYLFLYLAVSITYLVVYELAVTYNPNFNGNDLAMNLLSELLGMFFTVYIFGEYLIIRNQSIQNKKISAFIKELEQFLTQINTTFSSLLPEKRETIWSESLWQEELAQVDLSKQAKNATIPMPNYLFLTLQGERLLNLCQDIQQRYQELYDEITEEALLWFTTESRLLIGLTELQKIYPVTSKIYPALGNKLASYYPLPQEEDFEKITDLEQRLHHYQEKRRLLSKKRYKYRELIATLIFISIPYLAYLYFMQGEIQMGWIFLSITFLYGLLYLVLLFRSWKKKSVV